MNHLNLKKYYSLFALLCSIWTYGQCNVQASADTIKGCAGDTVYFSASNGVTYQWSGYAGIDCPTCASTFAVINGDGVLVVESNQQTSGLATNGDFTAGNTGFTTAYTYNATSIWAEGTYAIGPNPNAVHPNFGTWGDHTTGFGNYMLVNGSTSGASNLWVQSIAFPPSTTVTMSFWMLTFATPPGSLRLFVNNSPVGVAVPTPNTTGVWQQVTRTFTSSATGNTTVAIRTISTLGSGNDFGLDDISFSYGCNSSDTIYIVENVVPTPSASVSTTGGCDTTCATFTNTTSIDSSDAIFVWNYGDGSLPDTTYQAEHCFYGKGTYDISVEIITNEGCSDSALVGQVTVYETPNIESITLAGTGVSVQDGNYVVNSENPDVTLTVNLSQFDDYDGGMIDWGDGQTTQLGAMNNISRYSASYTYQPQNPLQICVEVDRNGCTDRMCVDVVFTPLVESPNAFSPNNDGLYDYYIPEFIGVDRAEWKVFNRWGQKVFESNSTTEPWDGMFNGRPVSEGVYFVVITAYGAYSDVPLELTATVHVFN